MVYYNLGPENEQIEYKKTTSELKEGVISIAAILNKHGKGTLYFGVKNNGDVIKESRRPIRRNPLITRTLYYSKDMESFATGLRRIQNFCDEAGVKVEYIRDLYGFTVRFHRHCGEGWTELGESDEPDVTLNDPQSDHEPQNGTQSISQNVTQSVTQNVTQTTENSSFKEKDVTEKIIEIIKNDKNDATRKSIARELSMTVRHVQRLLNKMPNVRYEGSSRSGHWVIIDDETKE